MKSTRGLHERLEPARLGVRRQQPLLGGAQLGDVPGDPGDADRLAGPRNGEREGLDVQAQLRVAVPGAQRDVAAPPLAGAHRGAHLAGRAGVGVRRDARPDVVLVHLEAGRPHPGVHVGGAAPVVGDHDQVVGGVGQRLELRQRAQPLALLLEQQGVVVGQGEPAGEVGREGHVVVAEGAPLPTPDEVHGADRAAAGAQRHPQPVDEPEPDAVDDAAHLRLLVPADLRRAAVEAHRLGQLADPLGVGPAAPRRHPAQPLAAGGAARRRRRARRSTARRAGRRR